MSILSRLTSIAKTFISRYQTLHLEYPVTMQPRYGHGLPSHSLLDNIIGSNRIEYQQWLEKVLEYTDQLITIRDHSRERDPAQPTWNNGFLPGLDIATLYTLVASAQPATYLEIGSGNSTKVVARAKSDHGLATKIISLDPAPRAEIDGLADVIIRQPLESSDLSLFTTLQSGDIVFVDNSHRIFPNSDATVFFMDVLPYLPPGVIVHIHDIYLPFDYPPFMCDRYYSEQYALAAFIMANPEKYYTILPNYFISEDDTLSQTLNPLWDHAAMPVVEKHGGSYWLRIQK